MTLLSALKKLTEDGWAIFIAILIVAVVLITSFVFQDIRFPVPVYKWSEFSTLSESVFSSGTIYFLLLTGVLFTLFFGVFNWISGNGIIKNLAGFSIVFLLAIISLIAAGNESVSLYGIEYVVFGLFFGMLLNNLFKIPSWITAAARSELFIKTGLVILGTSVLFTDIIKAGFPGLIQAIVVVLVVWFFTFWLSRKLKLDDEFGVILSSAVSICGVSAAIVAAGAIQGDKKKLSYVTTLVLLVAIPMMIVQPWAIRFFQIPEFVGGAWLGGTLDTTASVTAAAELVGPQALKVGVIIKFSQNVLIGLAAFFIASWWVFRRKNQTAGPLTSSSAIKSVWDRFPKFVLAFIIISSLFSFIIPADSVKEVSGVLNALRTIWFALAFVSIGLEAKFKDLVQAQGAKPAVVFVVAQLFNVFWTLLIAYLLFSGRILPLPAIS